MKARIQKPDGTEQVVVVTPRRIDLNFIRLFSDANRDVRQSHVNDIVRHFRPELVQVLTVNHRDGVLRLIDGQHRYLALRELAIESALCVVFEELTDEQEADLFVALNRGRLAVNAWDLWKQELRAGHQDCIAIKRIVEQANFKIVRHSGANHIHAIGALRRVWKLGGSRSAWLLTNTFRWISRMWLIDEHALDGAVIEGTAIFIVGYESDPNYDQRRLEQIIALTPAGAFIGRARKIVRERRNEDEATGGLTPTYIALAIAEFYNVGRPKTKRLGDPRIDGRKRGVGRASQRASDVA